MSSSSDLERLTCFCLGHCPDHNLLNGTCRAKPGGYCFASSEEVYDPITEQLEIETTYGCLPPDEDGFMQCKGHLVPHEIPKTIACCTSGDLCNVHLKLKLLIPSKPSSSSNDTILLTSLLLVVALLILTLLALIVIKLLIRKRNKFRNKHLLEDGSTSTSFDERKQIENTSNYSNSGSGVTLLVQRTIAKQTMFNELIGKGKYSEVWKCVYRDENVAVKIFLPIDEASWLREQEIYQISLLNHPNVLGFVAADLRAVDSYTQLLLITEYHQLGSLYDYLQRETFDESVMLRLMYSAISGLSHLHMELIGKQVKPAIAHRDLKSKNIIVKHGHICVISDFGLSVKYDSVSKNLDIPLNTKLSTIRYMPPEMLDSKMNEDRIESFKAADIYSMSLVLWEISRRCSINGVTEEYQLPYGDLVPNEPSFEEMRKIVNCDGRRPKISAKWNQQKTFTIISNILNESWQAQPRARLSALRIKKNLGELLETTVASV